MIRILSLLVFIILLTSCKENDKCFITSNVENEKEKNELLLDAYVQNDYAKCLEILRNGADGRIDYLKLDRPILFDICKKYLNNDDRLQGIEELLTFYLQNRKDAFTDSIQGVHPQQTVGSYLARFSSVELLRRIVQEKININSPWENSANSAIFELAAKEKNMMVHSDFFNNMIINDNEKKERMELLVDAGADVALYDRESNSTIFHSFSWWPAEEDYTELLDRIITNGGNLLQRDSNGWSCIRYKIDTFALDQNTETYLRYVISRGLEVTEEDLIDFLSIWGYLESDALDVTEEELHRLEEIRTILEENLKE